MKRFYWGLFFSGAFHVTLFAASSFLSWAPPSVPVAAGPSNIRVVFVEPKEIRKEEKKEITPKTELISKPIEVSEKKDQEKPREEIPVEVVPFVSIESSGVEKSEAEYSHNPAPRYPRAALLKDIQGSLVLSVKVNAKGEPLEVNVEKSSGYSSLDESAVEAVRKWHFIPAKVGAIAIASQVRIPVQFKIVNRR